MDNKRLMTQAELMDYLHVSKSTFNRHKQRCSIPYVKIGGAYRYDLDAVLEALKRDSKN